MNVGQLLSKKRATPRRYRLGGYPRSCGLRRLVKRPLVPRETNLSRVIAVVHHGKLPTDLRLWPKPTSSPLASVVGFEPVSRYRTCMSVTVQALSGAIDIGGEPASHWRMRCTVRQGCCGCAWLTQQLRANVFARVIRWNVS